MQKPDLEKLRYRAWRRGFREADLILGPFADAHLARLSVPELEQFERLLDVSDSDLYGWITGQAPTPDEWEDGVLTLIRGFRVPTGIETHAQPAGV